MTADTWHFPRTQLASTIVNAFGNNESPAFLIQARRRMGKTRFLLDDLKPLILSRRKWRCIYIDFWKVRTSPHVRLAHEIEKHLDRRHGDLIPDNLKQIKVANALEAQFYEARASGGPEALGLLLSDMINRLAEQEDKLVLLLDEFQEVATYPDGKDFMKLMRGALSERVREINTVFTGSSTAGLSAIFSDRKGPFFDFATPITTFGPFGEDFVDHCLAAFRRSSGRTLDRAETLAAFESLDRITQNFREYLRCMLYEPDLTSAAALERARQRFEDDYRFEDSWLALSPADRALLAVLASGEAKPFSKRVAEKIADLAGLETPPSRSSVQSMLNRMARGKLLDRPEDGGWAFMDPEFRRWVREQVPPG